MSLARRYAIWIAHGSNEGVTRCWLCYEPIIRFSDYEVDHVIPQSLSAERLVAVRGEFGLPDCFGLGGHENLLPAHGACNRLKRDHVFRPTPLIQFWLEKAHQKSGAVRKQEESFNDSASLQKLFRKMLKESEKLEADERAELAQEYASANSTMVLSGTPPGMMGLQVVSYVPPRVVQLGPNTSVEFEQVPLPGRNGPFIIVGGPPSANS